MSLPAGFEIRPVKVRQDGMALSPPVGSPEYYADMARHAGGSREVVNGQLLERAAEDAPPAPRTPEDAASPGGGSRRVFITCGRGDSFVVAVEEGPDWDACWQGKFGAQTVLAFLPILRALGVKILDRTGGELTAAGMEMADGALGQSRPKAEPAPAQAWEVQGTAGGLPEDHEAGIAEALDALGGDGG